MSLLTKKERMTKVAQEYAKIFDIPEMATVETDSLLQHIYSNISYLSYYVAKHHIACGHLFVRISTAYFQKYVGKPTSSVGIIAK